MNGESVTQWGERSYRYDNITIVTPHDVDLRILTDTTYGDRIHANARDSGKKREANMLRDETWETNRRTQLS